MRFLKKLILLNTLIIFSIKMASADVFLATHLLLNTLAVDFIPSYASTTFHGPYINGTYGYRYELGEAYKLGDDTEGSTKSSPGFGAGYQFLRSDSHKLALGYERRVAKFLASDDIEGDSVIDAFGIRFNWKALAFKFGWASHAVDDLLENKHDGGYFTGIGYDIYFSRVSFYMDITDYYLEDRDIHIAGGDIGFRFSFGDVN